MANKKFLVDIDVDLNQLLNGRIENGTGFVTGGANAIGRVVYDTVTQRILYDTGVNLETVATLNDVTGLLDFKGGYDALTNTPNLVTPPFATVLKGDYYVVTVAGTFYTENLTIGDSLFAKVDNPNTLTDWVIVQGNIDYENIYNSDGTLTGNRNVSNGGYNLSFTGTSGIFRFRLSDLFGRLSETYHNLTDYIVQIINGTSGSSTNWTDNDITSQSYDGTGNTTILKQKSTSAYLQQDDGASNVNTVEVTQTNANLSSSDGINTRILKVSTSGVNINSEYTFPNTDGTANQVMATDGSGNVSWTTNFSGTVTSVGLISGTWGTDVNIANSPITSSGDITINIPIASSVNTGKLSSSDWTTFNNKVSTTRQINTVAPLQGGGDLSADRTLTINLATSVTSGYLSSTDWNTFNNKVSSVGLTMPSAFTVTNSPVTSVGTINVTANGTSAQYIRGDGQLATLPTSTGGGASVTYYLNSSINQGTILGNTYFELNRTAIVGAGTDIATATDGIIARYITDPNDPSLLQIPNGAWNIGFFFSSSTNVGNPYFYVNIYKYDGVAFTLIASNLATPEVITNGTAIDQYFTSVAMPTTALSITDRIAIEVYVFTDGNTITLHTEDSHLCEVVTTISTGINALNGLTTQTQYFATGTSGTDFTINSSVDTHTFNLPVASSLNTGKLTNTDWTTFNNKQNAITLTTIGTSGVATFIADVLNIPDYSGFTPVNIYNSDGTVTAFRTITFTSQQVLFTGSNSNQTITLNLRASAGSGNRVGNLRWNNDLTGANSVVQVASSGSSLGYSDPTSSTIAQITASPTQTFLRYASGFANHFVDLTTGGVNLLYQDAIDTTFLTVQANGYNFNGSYILPKVDGTAGQVLTTDGLGNVSWGSTTSTNIYNSNGTLTANRTVQMASFNLDLIGDQNNSYQLTFQDSLNPLNIATFYYNISQLSFSIYDNTNGFEFQQSCIAGNSFINVRNQATNEQGQVSFNAGGSGISYYDGIATTYGCFVDNLGVSINNLYRFPNTDGTAGQVLSTNGAGVVSWATVVNTNIYTANGTLTGNRTIDANNFSVDWNNVNTYTATINPSGGLLGYTINVNTLLMSGAVGTRIFKVVDTNAGVERFGITRNGNVKFNDTYSFPLGDGTSGQVLTTNGAGVLSFQTVGSTSTTETIQLYASNPVATTNNGNANIGITLATFPNFVVLFAQQTGGLTGVANIWYQFTAPFNFASLGKLRVRARRNFATGSAVATLYINGVASNISGTTIFPTIINTWEIFTITLTTPIGAGDSITVLLTPTISTAGGSFFIRDVDFVYNT